MTFWEKLERTRFLIAPNTHRPGLCCWIFCFLVPITYIIRAFTTMNGTMVGVHTFYWILGIVQSSMTGLKFKTPDRSGHKTLVEWASKVTRQNYKKINTFRTIKSIAFSCLFISCVLSEFITIGIYYTKIGRISKIWRGTHYQYLWYMKYIYTIYTKKGIVPKNPWIL